jgi:hypothetical protein
VIECAFRKFAAGPNCAFRLPKEARVASLRDGGWVKTIAQTETDHWFGIHDEKDFTCDHRLRNRCLGFQQAIWWKTQRIKEKKDYD